MNLLRKAFIGGDWAVCYKKKTEMGYTMLKNPRGFWIADPFLLEINDDLYLYGEFYDKKKDIGQICCGKIIGNQVTDIHNVVSSTTHMSYPFIFPYKEKLFLIPENSQSSRVPLYEITNPPYTAKFCRNIFSNVDYVDSTIVTINGSILYLGYSETKKALQYCFLDDDLLPKSAIACLPKSLSSRPAGGQIGLGRPAQYCEHKYGEYIQYKEMCLTDGVFSEKDSGKFSCEDFLVVNSKKKIQKIHTINSSKNFDVIDVFIEKFSLFRWYHMLRRKSHGRQ